jgi:hypothetical protein
MRMGPFTSKHGHVDAVSRDQERRTPGTDGRFMSV